MDFRERKVKYRKIIELLAKGENFTSAARIVGYSTKHVSKLAKKPYFKRKIEEAEEILKGTVRSSLVKRAVGYDKVVKKVYQTKNGPQEVEEIEHYPGDVKAQLAYLQAKDKEGGWVNGNQVNIQVNQQLQGVSTDDLLLTLQSSQSLLTGGEGGSETVTLPAKERPNNLSHSYNPDYDQFHEKVRGAVIDNFHDHNNGKLDEPVEGMLDNVGEDECS